MEYAIFPMQTISISQIYTKESHRAWDINGPDKGKHWWHAPCRIKVLAVFPYDFVKKEGFYNTVLFGSCDENGNPAEVMCEDGVARVLTFGCTHMDEADFNSMNYQTGNQYASGTPCYCEGFTGLNPNNPKHGNHVHMDVAVGWHYKREKDETGFYHFPEEDLLRADKETTIIGNCFYQLQDFNTVGNEGTQSYTFAMVTSRTVDGETSAPDPTPEPEEPVTETFDITGYGLYVNKLGLNIRSEPNANSTKLVTVDVGEELKIREFLHGFQSDGYQWASTEYNGHKGYSQIDTHGYYTVLKTSTSVIHPESGRTVTPRNLYLVASSSGAYIKKTPTSTAPADRTFIAPGSKMKVIELFPGFQQHDGYQYAYVNYNGNVEGYVQIDVKSWHYFQVI